MVQISMKWSTNWIPPIHSLGSNFDNRWDQTPLLFQYLEFPILIIHDLFSHLLPHNLSSNICEKPVF